MPDQQSDGSAPAGVEFSESFVEADGFRIRYRQAGSGEVLICLHGGGGLRISRAHELLAHSRRLIAFEIPGFGQSPVNDRSASMEELAGTMNAAVAALGIDHYSIMGNSFGSKVALWMAILRPQVVKAVVVVGPAAIRLPRQGPPPGQLAPERAAELLYAHPERQPPIPPLAPEIVAKQIALSTRLLGPPRDEPFEARLRELQMPVLALFGTHDRVTPPAGAHLFREILPNCHLVMVYDAAHGIDADRPEAVAALVEDFLSRGDGFLVRRRSGLIYP
ncbi:MAG TPA: alpha/beta hydrolase [Candidatus Binataceae bacterium]|nr:alpha/beta hydrolase [Candidatus Binataceae bacterium]